MHIYIWMYIFLTTLTYDIYYNNAHLRLILISFIVLYNTDLDKGTHMFYLYFDFIYFLGCLNVVSTTEQSLYFGF